MLGELNYCARFTSKCSGALAFANKSTLRLCLSGNELELQLLF